jgi:CheY-like chemotaxis protein
MMENRKHPYSILMLEDDADDRLITETTFSSNGFNIELTFLVNGKQVMEYLSQCGQGRAYHFPDLVLLDKNIPMHNGLDVLREIKAHPVFKKIPVVMVSGTAFQQDVDEAYKLGVNSFIQKPGTEKMTIQKISSFVKYWFETVELPELV